MSIFWIVLTASLAALLVLRLGLGYVDPWEGALWLGLWWCGYLAGRSVRR